MLGEISQIFSTGDFSIWCAKEKRSYFCFVNDCHIDTSDYALGDHVRFSVAADGSVTHVAVHEQAA